MTINRRIAETLKLNLLSIAEERPDLVHLLVRTKHETKKHAVQNLEIVSLVKQGGKWLVSLGEQQTKYTPLSELKHESPAPPCGRRQKVNATRTVDDIPRVPVDQVGADERARHFQTRSIKNEAKLSGLRLVVSMMDLTTLEGQDTPGKVAHLCRKALRPMDARYDCPPVAAVCVYPNLVRAAKGHLAGTPVKVASVATAFPSGQFPLKLKLEDTRRAIAEGADEIDMVIDRGAFLAGEFTQGLR